MNMKHFLFSLACTLGLGFTVAKAQQTVAPADLSILFIGNSYTHMNEMPYIFDKIAKAKGKKIYVEMNTRSGASFQVHTTRPDLWQAIKRRKWSYVVLQGYSRELSYEPSHLDTATVPYVQQILDSIYLNNSCTKVLLHMTWGYKFGFVERPEIDTYEKMSDRISYGYTYLSEYFCLPIVPVGKVWREVRSKYPDIEMYDADLQHPSRNGSYTSACAFYAAIFKESPAGAITSTISAKNAEVIQKTAASVVLGNYEYYELNKNTYSLSAKRTKEGEYILTTKANFPNATELKWEFGDGKDAKEANTTHSYKKPGTYYITLRVQDECGERVYRRKVTFSPPPEPTEKPKKKGKKGNTPVKKI